MSSSVFKTNDSDTSMSAPWHKLSIKLLISCRFMFQNGPWLHPASKSCVNTKHKFIYRWRQMSCRPIQYLLGLFNLDQRVRLAVQLTDQLTWPLTRAQQFSHADTENSGNEKDLRSERKGLTLKQMPCKSELKFCFSQKLVQLTLWHSLYYGLLDLTAVRLSWWTKQYTKFRLAEFWDLRKYM